MARDDDNHKPGDEQTPPPGLELQVTLPTVLQPAAPSKPGKAEPQPQQIDRYPVVRPLGRGGFGKVYLARDDILNRLVAIKVPRSDVVTGPRDAAPYLEEARTVANLDHPNIVPVYDSGSTEKHPFFVVSKFIEGSTLSERLKDRPPSVLEATKLVSTVAETLHYAHRQGLFHRDIKPSNILLQYRPEAGGAPIPYVADFGLALKEKDIGRGSGFAGTPSYMSPEQARGEGNRVDGRSDIFSLGIVFYELLTGQRPFHADNNDELMDQIVRMEVRPPRQLADVPRELERICLKALGKRASDRYATAQDFADDLHFFLQHSTEQQKHDLETRIAPETAPPPPSLPSRPLTIVPHGLRSFDARDGDFFLELLPGPRDREGLPESIRFWKTRVEEMDADSTFPVGLVYGPSGCGKSSLLKAGLLPQLSENVVPVYVEATAQETETRLLKGLQKRFGSAWQGGNSPAALGLKDTLRAIRRGQGLAPGMKLLIILDQFEQWLHAKKDQENTELVEALRQCDGGRVQCLIMVRDDFWLAVSRFLKALEIRLLEGHNSALVDLFDGDHAKKVLAAFGRAFSKLPDGPAETSAEQKLFLTLAVAGLADKGKVICVRLALFAEMMKGKPWTPASLKAVGGTAGVGATFLEETFSASTAPREHQHHQKAARKVLKALLPEAGTDIKGHMRSKQDLLTASGYANRPDDFEDLLRILDSEVRLITPTDPEGSDDEPAPDTATPGQKYYQLTHDYLVPSLRDWLTRKQKETRSGRAAWLLEDLAAIWSVGKKTRQLPSLFQWLQIRSLTRKKDWTTRQGEMMRKATRYHLRRGMVAAAVLALVAFGLWEGHGRSQAHTMHAHLLKSSTAEVPRIVKDMAPFRGWLEPHLLRTYAEVRDRNDPEARKQKLNVCLALVSLALVQPESEQGAYLYERVFDSDPATVIAIRPALGEQRQQELWAILDNPQNVLERRFRAACALAALAPEDSRWGKNAPPVAKALVDQSPLVVLQWTDAFKPAAQWLLPPLADILLDDSRAVPERALIARVYGRLAETEQRYDALESQLEAGVAAAADTEKTRVRKTRIATALLAMDRGAKVWQLLKHTADPTLRTALIEELNPGAGIDSRVLITHLHEEEDASIRRALLLCLGSFGRDKDFLPELERLYREDPDPGIHGAAACLLGRLQPTNSLTEIDASLRPKTPGDPRHWYVNSQGQTMTIVASPGEFSMGEGTSKVRCRINHRFAIAAREVTLEQFTRFDSKHSNMEGHDRHDPALNVTWFEAAEYCNWLNEQEHIPRSEWCYEPFDSSKYDPGMRLAQCYTLLPFWPFKNNQFYGPGMRMAEDYLHRKGYRLPTEAEWEFACRAGAESTYSFGNAESFLKYYGWFSLNSDRKPRPVGKLKPNDFGLFDMHGNALEWTLDRYRREGSQGPGVIVDREDPADMHWINNKDTRILRGGSFKTNAMHYIPSGDRGAGLGPSDGERTCGFRVARTVER